MFFEIISKKIVDNDFSRYKEKEKKGRQGQKTKQKEDLFKKQGRLYYCCYMNETTTRRGTRQKKPPKTYWLDELDYNNLGSSRQQEQKEKLNSAQDINQIAKLLCKFLHSANQCVKELQGTHTTELPGTQLDGFKGIDSGLELRVKNGDCGMTREGTSEGRISRPRNGSQTVNGHGKVGTKESKLKVSRGSKSSQQLATLETDMNYHNALNEHVKNMYPNINALSPDMLKELSIPTDFVGRQQAAKRSGKEEKRVGVRGKEESKPFKRQSYHVAIAYHIHLKQVKNTKSVQYVDPTYPARRLRDQTQSQPEKP